MGAFFLYTNQSQINLEPVVSLFRAKGFSSFLPIYEFGSWSLLHFRKQLVSHESLTISDSGISLFGYGTFTYKGYGLQKSLKIILADYCYDQLDKKAILGVYCLLFITNDGITFLNDRMNLFHIFTNYDNTVFSSSFAAVLKAGPQKFRINILAALENILSGYIIGPETIVHGISLADNRYQRAFKHHNVSFSLHPLNELTSKTDRQIPFNSCVDEQLAELDQYFSSFKNLVDNMGGVDIGLSGGYDSRVLLLLAKRHFSKVYAHSHFHRSVTSDETCAEKISAATNVKLYRCAEAKQPAEMDVDEFEQNIENTAAFNDGRVIHDYSWLVYFRTRWYREAVLRDLRFGMNGLAGELYRNHDNHCFHRVDVRDWFKARVLAPGASSSLTSKSLSDALDHILEKAGSTLGEDLSSSITHHQTRRYFGELFSVYGAAVRMNIDNQLAFSLSPFLDYAPRLSSYRALPHIGLHGRFEAAMISRMDPGVASIPSSYGYPFNRTEPIGHLIKCAARGLIPYKLQSLINSIRFDKIITKSKAYETVFYQHALVQRAAELMKSHCFGLDIDQAAHDEVLIMRVISIGIMLLKYEDCIEL